MQPPDDVPPMILHRPSANCGAACPCGATPPTRRLLLPLDPARSGQSPASALASKSPTRLTPCIPHHHSLPALPALQPAASHNQPQKIAERRLSFREQQTKGSRDTRKPHDEKHAGGREQRSEPRRVMLCSGWRSLLLPHPGGKSKAIISSIHFRHSSGSPPCMARSVAIRLQLRGRASSSVMQSSPTRHSRPIIGNCV